MSGETNLKKLLKSMSPVVQEKPYIFCSTNKEVPTPLLEKALATFREKEGITLVLEKCIADQYELTYEGVFRCITLNVHSSLEAVGLTAAVSTKLAEQDISANVIAAYYHDHIFVPEKKAELALQALNSLP